MKAFISLARADWGPAFRATAGRVAYVVACAIVAAEMAWRAGQATGRALHWLNNTLAGLASGRIDRAATARAVVAWAHGVLSAPEPVPAPAVSGSADDGPSLADTFAAVAAAAAASDARIYRAAGDSLARMRAMLDEAETGTAETVAMACTTAPDAPAVGVAPPALELLTVAQLRQLARARGLSGMGRARRDVLLAALA